MFLDETKFFNFDLTHEFFIFPFVIVFIVGVTYFLKTKRKLDNVTKILNAISITLVIILFVNIGSYVFTNFDDTVIEKEDMVFSQGKIETLPNIYYIILDGYANSKLLKETLNYDNKEFVNYLQNRGFTVIENSYSNYARTFLSLSSTLNMKYLNELALGLGEKSVDQQAAYKMISNNDVMKNFNSFKIPSIP